MNVMQTPTTQKTTGANRALLVGFLRFVSKALIAIIALLSLYVIFALLGTLIAVNKGFLEAKDGHTIFVTTNGFHTEIVLPVQHRRDKCFQVLSDSLFSGNYDAASHIAFGWGDQDFYMDAYQHAFPAIPTILDAALVPGESLMHIEFYSAAPKVGEDVKAISLTDEQYEKLVDYVNASFRSDNEAYTLFNQAGYGKHDYFYKAVGKYHLFNTCNSWTGRGLREVGVHMSWWTPFEASVFYYLH